MFVIHMKTEVNSMRKQTHSMVVKRDRAGPKTESDPTNALPHAPLLSALRLDPTAPRCKWLRHDR